jgi:integrase
MEAARDLFVFQMFTGFAFSDAQKFNINDYKCDGGQWIHVGQRIKTGVPYVSQLLPPVIDILERWNWKVPKIDNSDYNRCLKALGQVAGIATPLHSHLARHTFATYMLRNGVKIENVSKMLGHTNITQTQRYAKVLAQSVREDFDRIAELIKSKKREE